MLGFGHFADAGYVLQFSNGLQTPYAGFMDVGILLMRGLKLHQGLDDMKSMTEFSWLSVGC